METLFLPSLYKVYIVSCLQYVVNSPKKNCGVAHAVVTQKARFKPGLLSYNCMHAGRTLSYFSKSRKP